MKLSKMAVSFLGISLFFCATLLPGQDFSFRSEWFSNGNMSLMGQPYSDLYTCLTTGGKETAYSEYEIEFPETGDYELWGFYTAQNSRPMGLLFDGNLLTDKAFATVFDSWQTSNSKWEKQADLTGVTAGKHVIRLQAYKRDIPHISGFKLVPKFEMKTDWVLPRAIAKEKILADSEWQPSPWSGGWYEYIARDRFHKKESGETFSDHFARETAIALVPEESLDIQVAEQPFTQSVEINLHDEFTYCPGMFDEKSDTEKTGTDDAPLYVKIQIAKQTDASGAVLPEEETFVFCPSKFQEILDRTTAMIERFRQDNGDDGYLAKSDEYCQKLREEGSASWQAFQAATGGERNSLALKYAHIYLDAIRLYAKTGWANPILDFEKLIFVQRNAGDLGLPQNYQSNCVLNPNGFDDTLKTLSMPFVYGETDEQELDQQIADGAFVAPKSEVLFKPDYPTFLGDLDLHFDAEKALVSSMDRDRNWNVYELDLNAAVENKPTGEVMKPKLPLFPEADSYDACYMPDDSVIFTSTACYIAVPCVSGTTRVTNTYRLYTDGTIRRLTFDQEHNWCPTLMPDGRVLYMRWEYTDIPHVPGRLLFEMNPDGTNQLAFYASNSLWPVSMFYARPIPGSTTKFACIVTGHHGVSRMGELVLFDVQKGRKENSGAVERICGYPKKVESRTDPKYHSTLWGDNISDESWPKFLHPYPLNEEYYLVAGKPDKDALWGLYLVDRYDNMILLAEMDNFACFEPVPWRETERPPVIMDRVDTSRTDATVYVADLYFGDGLKNIPRGTVKNLRLYSYSYLYPMIGGANSIIGAEGPWDVRQVLGTVPVNEDGSALFSVPANVPIAIQPLDENGEALQQMRSWFTAMPGEFLSCTGCHEDQNSTSPASNTAFLTDREIPQIVPWYGPMRGFSFDREVQPVLDHYCVACHDGKDHGWNVIPFELSGGNIITDYVTSLQMGEPRNRCGTFSTSYLNLHQFVRRPGLESDYFLLNPMEFSANTTELVQILRDGHYGLQMDAEAWDRILTWIDMNAPYHGTWTEFAGDKYVNKWNKYRKELLQAYANFDDESETNRGIPYNAERAGKLLKTDHSVIPVNLFASDWERQILKEVAEGKRAFPDGQELKERFEKEIGSLDAKVMEGKPASVGFESDHRYTWDRKAKKTEIWGMGEPYKVPFDPNKKVTDPNTVRVTVTPVDDKTEKVELSPEVAISMTRIPAGEFNGGKIGSFWMGTFEISNEQFEIYDPEHDSRVESRLGLSHGLRGFFVNSPERSVCRVSWEEANAFCKWLSEKTGKTFRLPTDTEWEYACHAGTQTPFSFGDWNTDFSKDANLGDQMLIEFITDQYFVERRPLTNVTYYDDWMPKDRRFCDNGFLSERSGRYKPNPWGLFDMHGNVAEWTSTLVKPNFGIDLLDNQSAQFIVRGGSWHDRPYRATSTFRETYYPWQRVFDVGFRVIYEE